MGSGDFGQKTLARIIIEKWPERGEGGRWQAAAAAAVEGHIVWQYDFEVWQLQECAFPDKNSKFGTSRRGGYTEVFFGERVLSRVLNNMYSAKPKIVFGWRVLYNRLRAVRVGARF